MKQLLLTITISLTLTLGIRANEIIINNDFQGNYCLEVNMAKSFTNQFGMFAYTANSQGWSEAYVGPTYSPASFVQVGIAAGIESDQSSTRFGGFLWAGHKQFSLLALGEAGGSGEWYRLEGKYAANSKTTVGILQEINLGTGLLIEQKLSTGITFRLRLYDSSKGDAGLKLAF